MAFVAYSKTVLFFVSYGATAVFGHFHVTSSPLCWWPKTNDLLLAPFVRPSAIVHCSIVMCVSSGLVANDL